MMRQKLRVLLVEDNPGDALLVRAALKEATSAGFIVMHEATLASAIERLTVSSAFDVVLLDLCLPDSESVETLPRLLAAFPSVPIVIMTGLDVPQVAEQAIELGAQDFIVKNEMDSRSLARTQQNAIYRFRSERERMALADMLAAEYDRMAEELTITIATSGLEAEAPLRIRRVHSMPSMPSIIQTMRMMSAEKVSSVSIAFSPSATKTISLIPSESRTSLMMEQNVGLSSTTRALNSLTFMAKPIC